MKKVDIRNYVLGRVKQQAFYQDKEIIDCGITGTCNEYWLELLDEGTNTSQIVKVQRPAQVTTSKLLGTFEQDTGGRVDVYVDDDGLLTI